MIILGIDTSFDDTSVAIVRDGTIILSNEVISQKNIHEKTGGVVPEIAARTHTDRIIPALKVALETAKISYDDIDAIAITSGPGLVGSLLVGTSVASVLGMFLDKPIYEINHIWGHLYANFLERELPVDETFPIIVLTVAGGHSDIVIMKDRFDFEIVGSTHDDASGEAFDKCARILGIADYMGGPELSKLATLGKPRKEFQFTRPISNENEGHYVDGFYRKKEANINFSFSGLKTQVRNLVETLEKEGVLSTEDRQDLAYEFQECVCDTLVSKLLYAISKYDPKIVFVTGGVSANPRLREILTEKLSDRHFYFPKSSKLCTDNAAMIAGACFFLKDHLTPVDFALAKPNFPLV